MGKRKSVLLALVFSLCSLTVAYGAQGKPAAMPEYAKIVVEATEPEELYGEYIPVLMYHHFADRPMEKGDGMVTPVFELEEHLRYLKKEGWQIISLEKLDSLIRKAEYDHRLTGKGLSLGQKYLCITMDDGYYSNYELAYPLFKKYRTPASVFAVTDFITEQKGLKKFTWEQAKEMDQSGWLKVYSHSADHVPVKAGEEEAFLRCMQKSDVALTEHLTGNHVKAMAYPNGSYTEEVQQLLDADGYDLQFTIDKGVLTRESARNAIPRITVESGMTGEDLVRTIELAAEKAFAAERVGKTK